jgi:hypothetical protein
MNAREVKTSVADLLGAGTAKSEVFALLSNQGVSDSKLAYLIAAYADPQRCAANRTHIRILVGIAVLQLVLSTVSIYFIGLRASPAVALCAAVLNAAFSALFVWGFLKNWVGVYNASLVLPLVALPKAQDYSGVPISLTLGLALGLVLFAYIWFVRRRLFPDFLILRPHKVNDAYVFTD